MVGSKSRNFAQFHHFVSRNADRISETIEVPKLKQSKVKTDVSRIQSVVFLYFVVKTSEMKNVIHTKIISDLTFFRCPDNCNKLFRQLWNTVKFH